MEQINILVVDDEKEIADLVEIYLVSDGYKVFKANNAQDGLELLEKEETPSETSGGADASGASSSGINQENKKE